MKTPWVIHDPNGKIGGGRIGHRRLGYRPIRLGPKGAKWGECLFIGDAGKDRRVLPLARTIMVAVNEREGLVAALVAARAHVAHAHKALGGVAGAMRHKLGKNGR